jgi:acetyl esterase/lipase
MPLDLRAQRFLERLAALKPPSTLSLSVAERRSALANLLGSGGPTARVATVEDRTMPGPAGPLTVRVYTPENAADRLLPGLVYFHGGGLVAGSLETHDGICRALTRSSGCRVLSVDYRLAPENRFPAALDDGCAAVEYIAGHAQEFAVDVHRLGICGDSAGATLAAAVCQRLAVSGQTCLALQVLLCPITDFASCSASRCELSKGYLLDEVTLQHDLRYYLGEGVLPSDPRVSPLRGADLSGLPSAFVHTAEYDPVRDEGHAYVERLRQAGVSTRYTCHSGMIHLFYGMGGFIPYAARAWEAIGAEIRANFSMS